MVLLTKDDSRSLKGFAISIIVLCHLGGYWIRYFTPLGGMGVTLFLICSGYGLEKSYEKNGLQQFWTKRIWSVFLPYAVFEILRRYVFARVGYASIIEFVQDVTLIKPLFGFGWYLNYLLIWYLFFYLSRLLIKNRKMQDCIGFIFSVCLLIYYVLIDGGLQIEQSFMFLFGTFLAKYDMSKIMKKKYAVLCMLIAVIALGMKQVPDVRNSTTQIMRWMDLITKSFWGVGSVITINVFEIWQKCKSVFGVIGDISFELYLIHGFMFGLVGAHIKELGGIVLFVLGSFMGAWIYHMLWNYIRRWSDIKLDE